MAFFNFLNFLVFFWNFLLRVGQERNGRIIFIFSISHPFKIYYGLKWSHNGIFKFFLIFFVIFLEFSIRHRVGTKRNDNFLFSLFPILFQPILAWNEFIMVFFNFFNFFLFFWNFLLRVRYERNGRIIFIFSISHHFTTYYGLKWNHNGILVIF